VVCDSDPYAGAAVVRSGGTSCQSSRRATTERPLRSLVKRYCTQNIALSKPVVSPESSLWRSSRTRRMQRRRWRWPRHRLPSVSSQKLEHGACIYAVGTVVVAYPVHWQMRSWRLL